MYLICEDSKKWETLSDQAAWDLPVTGQETTEQPLFPREIVLCIYDRICLVSQFINKTVQEAIAALLLITARIVWAAA